MKTNIACFYGCRSVEHEVSIISAVQAMRAINREKYDVTPVYVTKEGEMYTSDALFTIEEYRNLPALLKKSKKVFFVRENGACRIELKVLSKNTEALRLYEKLTFTETKKHMSMELSEE